MCCRRCSFTTHPHTQVSYNLKPDQLPEMAWRTATCWLRRVPDVHIVGCMKCGTTALNAYMQQHPGVESSDTQFVKEVRDDDSVLLVRHKSMRGIRSAWRVFGVCHPCACACLCVREWW